MAKPCKHLKGLIAADFRRQKTPVTWCYVHEPRIRSANGTLRSTHGCSRV
jgi:hypothetical protein